MLVAVIFALQVTVAAANGARAEDTWPREKVFVPKREFSRVKDDELDQIVLAANPRIYVYADFDPAAKDKTLVIGLPGWGGRSENFIHTMIGGLKKPGLTKHLVLASIQDLQNGGPQYQGQGNRANANVWDLGGDTVKAMRRFISRLSNKLGFLHVYLLGYSTGSYSGPMLATAVARWIPKGGYRMEGAISVGTGSPISSARLKDKKQRVLFIVVPVHRGEEKDGKPMRDDQRNRRRAERNFKRLTSEDVGVFLRHIESARRHIDWHWGLLSQCRFFPKKTDPGRGYYPNYWMPNPETYDYVTPFVEGRPPPEKAADHPPQPCPY